MIDFTSSETHLMLNPRMPRDEREPLERAAVQVGLRSHVLIASSGSTGVPRLTALAKEAVLASAAAVNRHLDANQHDVWCCVLPTFHVGGMGIYARAFLSGARVVSSAWTAHDFVALCDTQRVTLSALVPAQVFDLVRGHYKAPQALRAIVIGGGALPMHAYMNARELGWPVLPSYGLTECCSQVATAKGDSPELMVLDHLEVKSDADGRLLIAGASLLTGYVDEAGQLVDPKRDGWFLTSDLGHVEARSLTIEGRADDLVKIGGELVNVVRLEGVLESVRGGEDAAIVIVNDERLGSAVHLASASANPRSLIDAFNARVHPFERIRRAHRVEKVPRSALGKVRKGELRRIVEEALRGSPKMPE